MVFGESRDFEVDVTNVLRLVVTANLLSGNETQIGLANAQLLGGAAGDG